MERRTGHFVVISSIIGYVGTSLRSSYSASKHALHGFFDSLRLEHVDDNINVSIVCPGFVRTAISQNALEGSGLAHGKMDPRTDKGTDPTVCALDILRGVANRKHEIYCAHMSYFFIYLRRFFPRLLYYYLLRTRPT
jgi:dehydrogenase/reductase SDR family protein 7B